MAGQVTANQNSRFIQNAVEISTFNASQAQLAAAAAATSESQAAAAAAIVAPIAGGTGIDAGTVQDTDIIPTSRGLGFLSQTALRIKNYVLAAITGGTSPSAGTLTGAETIPISRGNGLLQTTPSNMATFILSLLAGSVTLDTYYLATDGNDYAPSFRRAISALNAIGGGRILLGNKVYRVVSTASSFSINVGANITIEGSQFTEIDLDTDVTGATYRQLFSQTGNNVTLRNLTIKRINEFQCVMITQGAFTGLTLDNVNVNGQFNVYGANYCHFLQVGTGVTGGGIVWKGGSVQNCSYGLFMTVASTSNVTGILVDNVAFSNNYATDLEFNSPNGNITDATVRTCNFANNQATAAGAGFAVGFAHVTRGRVIGGTISGYYNEGIHCEDYCADIVVDGVALASCGRNQGSYIQVISGCDGVIITNSYLDASANTTNIPLINVLAGGSGTTPGGRTVLAPRRVSVNNNPRISCGANCSGIYFESVLNGTIANNTLLGTGSVSGAVYVGSVWWGINVYSGRQITVTGNSISGFLWGAFPRRDSVTGFGSGSTVSGNSFYGCALGLALLNPDAISVMGNSYYNCVKSAVIGQGSTSVVSQPITYVGNNAVGCAYPQAITGTNTVNYSGSTTIATGGGVSVPIVPLDTYLPSGTALTFTGGGVLTLTLAANSQATSLTGNLVTAAIASGATATYGVTFAAGTVVASNNG